MNRVSIFLSAALLAGAATYAALAPATAAEKDFLKVDANADGQVSMEEAKAAGWNWTAEQMKAADKDGSGALSAEEFKLAAK
jgi:hypothetical protein